jgi:hypothetical protein
MMPCGLVGRWLSTFQRRRFFRNIRKHMASCAINKKSSFQLHVYFRMLLKLILDCGLFIEAVSNLDYIAGTAITRLAYVTSAAFARKIFYL